MEHQVGQPSRTPPVSGPSKSNGKIRSAVNKTYSLAAKLDVLKYVTLHSESEASRHFDIPRTTIRGWKGLDKRPAEKKNSLTKKGANKVGAGQPLSYDEKVDMEICEWVLEMRDLHLPIR